MILNVIKGMLIGIALIVPGLSGSIFAIILGLYEKGLNAIANFWENPLYHLKFLLPIALGGGIGILASARLMLDITARFPAFSYLFFCGLVVGSAPLVFRKINKASFKPIYLIGTVSAFLVVVIMGTSNVEGGHISLYSINTFLDFFSILFAGLASVSLMAVPGISGSIIIIILGHFGTVYNAVSETVTLLFHILSGNWFYALESLSTVLILVPFALGALIGIVTAAKIMTHILKNYEVILYYFVLGALLGTITVLFNIGVINNIPLNNNLLSLLIFIFVGFLCSTIGIILTLFLDRPDNYEMDRI